MTPDNDSPNRNLWKTIGSLPTDVQWLIERQQRTDDRLDRDQAETNDRLERGQKETNGRIDRLLYAVIGLAGGVIALLVVEIVRN